MLDKQDILGLSRDAVMQTRFRDKNCFQFDITLEYDKDKKEIKANPMAEDWINAIPQHFEASLKNLTEVKCFLHERLGRIHPDVGHVIFQTDSAFAEEYPEREVLHITFLLQRLFKVLDSLLASSNEYSLILSERADKFQKKLSSTDFTVEDYQQILQENKRKEEEIEELFFEDTLLLGPMVIRVGKLKKQLNKKLAEQHNMLLGLIKKKVEQSKTQIEEEVDKVMEQVTREKYDNIEEVTEARAFIKKLPDKEIAINRIITSVKAQLNVLEENLFQLKDSEVEDMYRSFARPVEINQTKNDCIELLDNFAGDFQVELRRMQDKLTIDIQEIQQTFEQIQDYEELKDYQKAGRESEQLDEKIYQTIAETEVCNKREGLYGLTKTDFGGIKIVRDKFDPFNRMWTLATNYHNGIQNWMGGAMDELDGDVLPREIDEAIQTLKVLKTRHFKEFPYTANICQELRDLYLKLKPFMPILNSLKNDDFKINHCDIIKKDFNIEIKIDYSQSLKALEDLGIMEIADEIIEISAIATKERQLFSQLNKMIDDWKTVKFELEEFRDSEVYILKGLQSIWDLLDEHIQKTMIISSSPYAKYFLDEALFWKSRLVKVQDILEEWSRVQRGWCYLWPIFSSPDIQTQLPEVFQTFATMDKLWRMVMTQTQQTPVVLDACNVHKVFENMVHSNGVIESVKKKLNEYLHSKQLLFPRFFFLSNDDLLHILSQTKDPVRVQDHLNKCFEGI